MGRPAGLWLWLLAPWLLAACATPSHPLTQAWEQAPSALGCESPDEDRCVVLACEEGLCGFFLCEDVMASEVPSGSSEVEVERVLARRPGLPMGPARPGRWWRRSPWLRGGSEPVMTFRWYPESPVRMPAPRAAPSLPAPRLQKHHIFPQAEDLARWFKRQGINIHDYTLLIPEHLHRRIHAGGPGGGLWNDAWRQFRDARRNTPPTREEIYRYAGELIYRFELTGPVMPYFRQLK